YVERGAELWEELVEAGELSGEAAEMPESVSLYEAVADIAETAEQTDDLDLMLRWYVALGFHLGMEAGEDEDALLEELQQDADVQRFRRQIADIEDLEMKLHHPSRKLDLPPPPLREAHPVLEWWFKLV
ncbi:MAG: hypothetical protein ABEN55_04755, partial [Bradymonadaceae bacterium]